MSISARTAFVLASTLLWPSLAFPQAAPAGRILDPRTELGDPRGRPGTEGEPSAEPSAQPNAQQPSPFPGVLQVRFASAGAGVTAGPDLTGTSADLSANALEVEGILAPGSIVTYGHGSLGGLGVAIDGGGTTVGHGGVTPSVDLVVVHRWEDARVLETCAPALGGSFAIDTGFQRPSVANLASLNLSGGIACQDGSYLLLLNASAGAGVTLPDSPPDTPSRTDAGDEAGVNLAVRLTLGTDTGLVTSLAATHLFLLNGESITTGELRAMAPIARITDAMVLQAGVSAQLMRRNDTFAGETAGGGASLMIGIGPVSVRPRADAGSTTEREQE